MQRCILYAIFPMHILSYMYMNHISHAEVYSELYAFQYHPTSSSVVRQSSGWMLYDAAAEFKRMGVPVSLWKETNLNSGYKVGGFRGQSGR